MYFACISTAGMKSYTFFLLYKYDASSCIEDRKYAIEAPKIPPPTIAILYLEFCNFKFSYYGMNGCSSYYIDRWMLKVYISQDNGVR